jgi:hypothetical protein
LIKGNTMNTTSNAGSTDSSTRIRTIGKIAVPAAAAAASIVTALGAGIPGVLGGMNLGNHNEALLPATVDDAARREVRSRRWRRSAASALVITASLSLGAVAAGFGSSPGRDHGAYPGQYCSSSGGGERKCQPRPTGLL